MPPSAMTLLLPWELSPTVLVTIALAVTIYAVGCARAVSPVSSGRCVTFYLCLLLIYCALQTRWDYYASHMFFVHRLQHFVLHDIGPALLAASAPAAELARGLPQQLGRRVMQLTTRPSGIRCYARDGAALRAALELGLGISIAGCSMEVRQNETS